MKLTSSRTQTPMGRSLFIGCVILGSVVILVLQVRWMNQRKVSVGESTPVVMYSRIIDLETQRIFCSHCAGSGFVRNPLNLQDMSVCPVCFGLGMHQVRPLEQRDVMCADCRGMGRIPGEDPRQATTCASCGGRGLTTIDKDLFKIQAQRVICEHCDGRGVYRPPSAPKAVALCPVCFGLGSHLVRRLDDNDELCPACGGMGRVADASGEMADTCERCGGRGLVLDADASAGSAGVTPAP